MRWAWGAGLAASLLIPSALQAQLRSHYIHPSPLYIPATGMFAGKGAFRIVISDNPQAVEGCTTTASVTPDPTGAVVVDPLNVTFSYPSYLFDVTVKTGQLTRFTLPVRWIYTCVTPARESAAQDTPGATFSVLINSSIVIALGNAAGIVAENPNATNAGDPVSTAGGELHGFDEPDIELGGPLPVQFRRFYSSQLSSVGRAGRMGVNWTHNFDARVSRSDTTAVVTLFRGQTVSFTRSGSTWQVDPREQRPHQLQSTASGYLFLDAEANLIYTFAANGSLMKIEDRNGNALTITQSPDGPSRVDDGLGRSLIFTYNPDIPGLVKVADQTGRAVNLEYTAQLSAAIDTAGKRTRYNYAPSDFPVTGLMTSAVLPAGNTPFRQEYDDQRRVIRQLDSRGNATRLEFGQSVPETTAVTDPLGGVTRHTYGLPGSVTRYVDELGRQATYEYDSSNRRTAVTDRRGGRTVTAYHAASGLPASITDAAGGVASYAYTAQTQGGFTYFVLTGVTYADGTTESFAYDARGNRTGFTDRAGKETAYTYNNRGQILTERSPAGGVTTYAYNADGTVAAVTLPSNDRIVHEYDTLKRLTRQTFADGSTRQFTYDARDRLLTSTDERGKRTTYAYNDNGKLQTVTGAANQVTRLAYDTDERISTVTDALGRIERRVYDAAGRLTSTVNGANETESYSYDAAGNLTRISDSAGLRLQFSYDGENAVTAITDGDSKTIQIAQDALGRPARVTNPLANSTSLAYDAVGQVRSITDPLGEVTQLTYDPRGLPSSISLPQDISAKYTRNDLGLITAITDPNGSAWTRSYDASGRETARTDPLGHATSYSYDNRQRVRQVTLPEGSLTLLYDAAGNLTRRQYSDGTNITYTYDDNNRVTAGNDLTLAYDANGRITSSNGIQVAQDAAGRISSITYAPGRTVTYEYNSQGLLTRIRDWVGGSTDFSYDNARRLASTRRPNGVSSQLGYDAAGRLASSTWTGGAVTASIKLERDAAGRVVAAERNLPRAADLGEGTDNFSYDAAHQIAGRGHDRMGRVVSGGGRGYTWDLASRLTSLTDSSGASNFRYDAFGQMVAGRRNYVWNFALPLPSIAAARVGQADERYYVHMPSGQLLYSIDAAGNQRRFYHYDETGSTVFLTGDAGEVTDTYAITPYGEVVSRTGSTDNPFTFLGAHGVMQIGDSGLYYMRARFYDATTARFLTPDPVRLLDPRTLNPYQYALANPLGFADPRGTAAHISGQIGPPIRHSTTTSLEFKFTKSLAGRLLLGATGPESVIGQLHATVFFAEALTGILPLGSLGLEEFEAVFEVPLLQLDGGTPVEKKPSVVQYVDDVVVVV